MDKKKKSNARFGIVFAIWVLVALLLFILLLINWTRISSNLKETGFFEKVFGSNPEFVENAPDYVKETNIEKNEVAPGDDVEIDLVGGGNSSVVANNDAAKDIQDSSLKETLKPEVTAPVQEEVTVVGDPKKEEVAKEQKSSSEADTVPQTKPVETPVTSAPSAGTTSTQTAGTTQQATTATMNLKLFYMDITSNGSIIRHEVTRKMPKSESPLRDAVNALIAGPNAVEQSVGCTSLVSAGTKLLGASVKQGTATLNFSADFEFNQYGVEGLRGQLQQIVFTATAFPTVDNVQFLVEGKKKQYLGEEGVWIGSPLDRNSF